MSSSLQLDVHNLSLGQGCLTLALKNLGFLGFFKKPKNSEFRFFKLFSLIMQLI